MNSDGDFNWATRISSYYFPSCRFQFIAFLLITVAEISFLHLKKESVSISLPAFTQFSSAVEQS